MKGMASRGHPGCRHLPSDASVPHPALACPPVSWGGAPGVTQSWAHGETTTARCHYWVLADNLRAHCGGGS